MAIIYSYPLNDDIKPLDELVGTTEKTINGQLKTVTRNFLLQDLAEFFIVDGGLQKTITLTTTDTDGAATLNQLTGVLNIPRYDQNGFIKLTSLSSIATGLTYNNTTGVFSLSVGYSIPTTASQTNWDTAYNYRLASLTTTGTSGPATLAGNVLNIPDYSEGIVDPPITIVNGSSLFSTGLPGAGTGSNASNSNFFGYQSGSSATDASNSNFFGPYAGNNATDASDSNFFGFSAGFQAANAYNSNFLGFYVGFQATNASYSNFLGENSGYQATNASSSNFFGYSAGREAAYAGSSNFFGFQAGNNATNASNSNFFGSDSGNGATDAYGSNFFGYQSGNGAINASYSNLLGYQVGLNFPDNNIGSNNIIIGTNISLPDAAVNSINLGSVLFGTGTYSTVSGDPSIAPTSGGKIGIGVVEPTNTLHIYSEAANTSGLRLERLTSSSPTSTGQAVGVDANGNVVTVEGGGGGNTNLSTSQTSTNFTINSDTGTDASVPLGDGTLAGATLNNYTTTEKNKLAAITGTNTGDQNLQSVTTLGASTDNTITINTINKNGLNINTSGSDTTKSAMVLTSTLPDAFAFKSYSYNGSVANYFYADAGDCIALQADYAYGSGLNITSAGAGIIAYSIAYPVVELNQALTNKGLVINGGTSSTGNFIELAKNSVNKLIVNQSGELTAQKLIKDGGTSSQILAADGSVITAGTNITISGGQISSVGGSGGGGSTVNYYLNGGTSQGTFGGTTYYEFSKTAVIGTGADFSRSSNGYIASFITDVADPSLLLIPAGNWNLEFFFSASSNGGSPSFYVELYKYNGTTFTLITSNSTNPEGITGGTAIDAYFTPLAVPETILTVNDRLAIRVFVNASSKTITLHTQNGHLCEVITTFTSGLTALNGLQAQVQNFATGTTGTDFDIVSSGSTHTFNLPSASATARGVVTTGAQTFAGLKTFTDNLTAARYLYSGGSIFPEFGQTFYINGTGATHYFGGGTSNAQNNLEVSNGTLKIGLQTASTIASFDANKNVVSLPTATYPSLIELTYVKGVTSGIQTQLNDKQPINANLTSISSLSTTAGVSFVKVYNGTYFLDSTAFPSQSAYTMLANNTASSAVPTEQPFENLTNQTYSGTIVWGPGAAPSTNPQHTYSLSQVGNLVTLIINLSYGAAGAGTLTSVACELPSTAPLPALPTSVSAALDIINYGTGVITTSKNLPSTNLPYCALRIKSVGTPNVYEVVVTRGAAAYRYAYATIQYFV